MEEGMTNRFCTLHLVFRAEGNQPKPTIIFWGQGLRLTRLEKESWDPRVNVMFQKKKQGWPHILKHLVQDIFYPFCAIKFTSWVGKSLFLWQSGLQNTRTVSEPFENGQLFQMPSPSQSTSETQPVDARLGRLVTFHIAQEFKSWLEIDENLELWENWKLSASEKRDFSD